MNNVPNNSSKLVTSTQPDGPPQLSEESSPLGNAPAPSSGDFFQYPSSLPPSTIRRYVDVAAVGTAGTETADSRPGARNPLLAASFLNVTTTSTGSVGTAVPALSPAVPFPPYQQQQQQHPHHYGQSEESVFGGGPSAQRAGSGEVPITTSSSSDPNNTQPKSAVMGSSDDYTKDDTNGKSDLDMDRRDEKPLPQFSVPHARGRAMVRPPLNGSSSNFSSDRAEYPELLLSRRGSFGEASPPPEQDPNKGRLRATEICVNQSSIREIRRNNMIFIGIMILFAVLLAAVGAIGIGVANSYFAKQSQKEFLQVKNFIVVNSSTNSIKNTRDILRGVGTSSIAFVDSLGSDLRNFSDPASARDYIRRPFLEMWSLWVQSNEETDELRIRLTFCEEDQINSDECPMMIMGAGCCQYDPDVCYLVENTDDGLSTAVYSLTRDNGPVFHKVENPSPPVYASSTIDYYPNRTSEVTGYFQDPTAAFLCGEQRIHLTYRRQVLRDGHILFVDMRTYFKSFLDRFLNSMQSAADSYIAMFSSTGSILAYDYLGLSKATEDDSVPCNYYPLDHIFWDETNPNAPNRTVRENCGKGDAGYIDLMTTSFLEDLSPQVLSSFTYRDIGGYHVGRTLKNRYVAYQDFLRFEEAQDVNTAFFVAYATPISSGIDHRGILQIVICVVIIVVCVVVLGTVTVITVFHMQRVLAIVSQLATHAATYDTVAMERTLRRSFHSKLSCCFSLFPQKRIQQDFFRILSNLKMYRPFLPQALLAQRKGASPPLLSTHGSAIFPDIRFGGSPTTTGLATGCNCDDATGQDSPGGADYRAAEKNANAGDVDHRESESPGAAAISADGTSDDRHSHRVSMVSPMSPDRNLRLVAQSISYREVKGTIMAVEFNSYSPSGVAELALLNDCVAVIVAIVHSFNGVIEVLEGHRVIISFNCHYTVPRHQERACKCAIAIERALSDSPFAAVIGIASGTLNTCIIGSNDLKATVLLGEPEYVARELCLLARFLSLPIVATDAVVHRSGSVSSVPVDVLGLRWPNLETVTQVSVHEVLRSSSPELPLDYAVARKMFQFIRSKQVEPAVSMLESYRATLKGAPLPWRLQRLELLLRRRPELIQSGYRRLRLMFEAHEGGPTILNRMRQTAAELGNGKQPPKDMARRLIADVPGSSTTAAAVPESVQAKTIIEETQLYSQSRRVRRQTGSLDSSEALFPVFVSAEDSHIFNQDGTADAAAEADEVLGEEAMQSRPTASVRSGSGAAALTLRDGDEVPRALHCVNGQVFYRTDHVLGRGGFGTVYLGLAEGGSFVAIKMVSVLLGDAAALTHEVETLQRFRHENIVAYDSCGVEGEYFFITMEYVGSGSVMDLMRRMGGGPLPESTVRCYCRSTLRGLSYLHENNCFHCDVKPDNILLSEDGECKLGDFGTASLERSIAERGSILRGTPRYMAPEAALGRWGPCADVFSFGITVAYMLTGLHPFHKYTDPDHIFLAHYTTAAKEALDNRGAGDGAARPTIELDLPTSIADGDLQQLVTRCCELDPARRPTVNDLLNLLS